MNCKEFSDLLDAYLDGELTPEEETALRDHAALCPDCAARLLVLQDSHRLDRAADVPEEFSAAWRKAVREEEASRKVLSFPRVRRYAAAAAALVLVAGGALLAWGNRPALNPAPAAEHAAAMKASGIAPMATMMPMANVASTNKPAVSFFFSSAVANSNMSMAEEAAPEETEAEEAVFFEDASASMEAWAMDDEEDAAREAVPAAAMMAKAADSGMAETTAGEAKLVIVTGDLKAGRAALVKLTESLGGSVEDMPEANADGVTEQLRAGLPRDQWPVFLAEAQKLGASAESINEAFAAAGADGKDGLVRISVILQRAE